MKTETRNATLQDMAALLQEQDARKIDVVAPASKIRAHGGHLVVEDVEPILGHDGVTMTNGVYRPTKVADEGIAEKLGIPVQYLRRMRDVRPDLYDANVNGWLHGLQAKVRPVPSGDGVTPPSVQVVQEAIPADSRSFLVRAFRGDEEQIGVARAFLSDRYKPIDNLDVLLAALDGIRAAGVDVSIDGCDLSERRMYVRVVAPQVTYMAETLLKGYRNPFGEDFEKWRQVADREGLGYGDGSEPIVFAGLVITNSEVGNGAFSIVPRAVIKVCKNGLTINADMMREVHLGGKLDEGVIDWSSDTQEKAVELVTAKTRDAVTTFLSPDYLERAIGKMEEKAGARVQTHDEVQVVLKKHKFTKEHVDGILNRFTQGGQMTLGGVANAVTAHAQTLTDSDEAHALEEQAVRVLS